MAKTTKKKTGEAKLTQYYSSSLFLDIDEHGNVTEGSIDMDGVVDPCGMYGEMAGQFSTKSNLLWNGVKTREARWHIVEQLVEFLKKRKREEKKAVDEGALSTPTPPPGSPLEQALLDLALGLSTLAEGTSKQREDMATLGQDVASLVKVTFKQGEDITAAKNNAILAIETAGKAQDTADGAVETAGRADKKADEACSTIKKLEKKLSHLMQSTKMNFEEDAETNNKLGHVTNMKQDIAGHFPPNQASRNFFDSGSKGSDNLDTAVPVPTTPSNATSHGATSSQKTAFKCVTTVLFGSPIPKFSPMSRKKYDKEYNQCSGSDNCGHCDKLKHTKTPSSGFSRFGFGW